MPVKFKEELSPLEQLALVPMSYSRLDTYFNASFGCKAKYFYQYIAKEPRGFGAAALLGNVVHQVLENALEDGMVVKEELVEAFADEFGDALFELDKDGIITEEMQIVGMHMLTEFVDRHKGEKLTVSHKELAFEIVVGTALIRGFIDRVDEIDGRVIITDYKSGSYEVAKKDIPKNLQLGVYALVAEKMFPGKDIYAQMYYLKSGRQKGHLFSTDDLRAIETNLTSLVAELLTRQNYGYTPNARACYMCDYAKTDVCPMGAKRIKR